MLRDNHLKTLRVASNKKIRERDRSRSRFTHESAMQVKFIGHRAAAFNASEEGRLNRRRDERRRLASVEIDISSNRARSGAKLIRIE